MYSKIIFQHLLNIYEIKGHIYCVHKIKNSPLKLRFENPVSINWSHSLWSAFPCVLTYLFAAYFSSSKQKKNWMEIEIQNSVVGVQGDCRITVHTN